MTYIAGGNIEATDYNTFATAVGGINEIFSDLYPGSVPTVPGTFNSTDPCTFGYGQSSLTSVASNTNVTAVQWNGLFTAMRSCGTHQGTTVVPPLPLTGPAAGDDIVAVTDEANMLSILSNLGTNRFLLAPLQTTLIVGTTYSNPGSWSSQLVYTFQVDFGTWDNARYYFNSGGSIALNMAYSPAPTPDEVAWANLFSAFSPLQFNYNTTTPQSGGNDIVSPRGFYGLTNAGPNPGGYYSLYQKYVGGGAGPYYSTNYMTLEAKLASAAGTNGLIDFRVTLVDGDTFPVLKAASRVSITVNRFQSSAPIAYPGAYSYTNGGFVLT